MSNKMLSDFRHRNANAFDVKNSNELGNKGMSVLRDSSKSAQMSVSFAGCGFLSFYYLGVSACLKQYKQFNENTIFCGASSGVMAGLALCLDLPLEKSTWQLLDLVNKVRAKPLGVMQPSCDLHKMIFDSLMQLLPDDCHKRVSGRLFVSVTRVSDGQNVLISQFDSKEDLIQAIQCSSYIPFMSGISPPKYKGKTYIDGALSNYLPTLSENTLTISPWSGQFDICPINETSFPVEVVFYNSIISLSPLNLYRMSQIATPPTWQMKRVMCHQGYNDALGYLLRNGKISCNVCLAIKWPLTSVEDLEEDNEISGSDYDIISGNVERYSHNSAINCTDCKTKQEVAVNDSLPEAVVQAIEESSHKVNQQFINRLCGHLLIQLLIFLFIPFLLLFELIIALVLGIFMNEFTIKRFIIILKMLEIMITNGFTGWGQKTTFL